MLMPTESARILLDHVEWICQRVLTFASLLLLVSDALYVFSFTLCFKTPK